MGEVSRCQCNGGWFCPRRHARSQIGKSVPPMSPERGVYLHNACSQNLVFYGPTLKANSRKGMSLVRGACFCGASSHSILDVLRIGLMLRAERPRRGPGLVRERPGMAEGRSGRLPFALANDRGCTGMPQSLAEPCSCAFLGGRGLGEGPRHGALGKGFAKGPRGRDFPRGLGEGFR